MYTTFMVPYKAAKTDILGTRLVVLSNTSLEPLEGCMGLRVTV